MTHDAAVHEHIQSDPRSLFRQTESFQTRGGGDFLFFRGTLTGTV